MGPMVGERRVIGRSGSGNPRGRDASEDAGISSEKTGENPVRRKPQVSSGRLVLWRLAGPKPKACAVGDGQTVKIPSPDPSVITKGGTLQQDLPRVLEVSGPRAPWKGRKIPPSLAERGGGSADFGPSEPGGGGAEKSL